MYGVYTRYLWQGNHQIYGHIRCMYTVLTNPNNLKPINASKKMVCSRTLCLPALGWEELEALGLLSRDINQQSFNAG